MTVICDNYVYICTAKKHWNDVERIVAVALIVGLWQQYKVGFLKCIYLQTVIVIFFRLPDVHQTWYS